MNGHVEDLESSAATARLFDRRDRQNVQNYFSFARGSVRRHRLLFAAVFVSIVGTAIASIVVLPKSYHVEAKTLAQRNSALTVRGDGPDADSLTRAAAETVLRRDNLLGLIRQTDLLQYTVDHRAPIQRWEETVAKAFHMKEDSDADRLDALIELLEKKMSVWTGDGGSTVTIALDWSDGPMACRLVDAAQRAFLDARYAREITALAESIEILRSHTSSLKTDIDDAVTGIDEMEKPQAGAPPPAGNDAETALRPRAFVRLRLPAPAPAFHPELDPLKVQIDTKQRAIDELEEFRRHRLNELQARLAELRTTYTESHPDVAEAKQSIAVLSGDSSQITSLRQEVAALRAEYERKSAGATQGGATSGSFKIASEEIAQAVAPPPPSALSGDVLRREADLREDRDPGMMYARGQLRDAMEKYAALRTQIESTQIDLETAQAAFKYRYSVVTPAHLPRSPTKPNAPLVVFAAIMAALLCSIVAAILVDVTGGRLLERWQIERLLDRPVLGEIAATTLERPEFQ